MRLLVGAGGGDPIRVLLFGNGLVGSAVKDGLFRRASWMQRDIDYSWVNAEERGSARECIADAMSGTPDSGSIHVVWAAGVTGFASSEAAMTAETGIIGELFSLASRLGPAGGPDVYFHLVSSAGGLFEGVRHVTTDTQPAPSRPYGHGKLEQEERLLSTPGVIPRIYRLSSVYGFEPGGRRGLFAALIVNAHTNRVSVITGRGSTLRDYVSNTDVGDYIAEKILQPDGPVTSLLASARPVSMFEVISQIEQIVARPLYLRFEPHATNAQNMSFAASGLPASWHSSPLSIGMRRLVDRVVPTVLLKQPGKR